MIDKEQLESLVYLWDNEQDDTEWRDHLTEEEAALVDEWDKQYDKGILKLATDILEREEQKTGGDDNEHLRLCQNQHEEAKP